MTNKFDNTKVVLLSLIPVFLLHIVIILYGEAFFTHNFYNSYSLQAQAWLSGNLHLPENYSWLEIAEYMGKYYVSFPPFPSYVLLPFVMIFGSETPDNLINFAVMLLGSVFMAKIALHYCISKKYVVFLPAFIYISSATLQFTLQSGVWFFAQNMSFTLSVMSIYFALKSKKGLSLFLLCAAVGCRPFQIVFLPLIIYILLSKINSEKLSSKFKLFFFNRIYTFIPATILATSFMLLNYFRFGDIFEFGHNYLPEFVESLNGQFDLSYFFENLPNLFRLPELSETGKITPILFNGMNIFISFPIILFFVYAFTVFLIKYRTDKKTLTLLILISALSLLQIFLILTHKTMGGYHYGNRYIADILPMTFLGVSALFFALKEKNSDDLSFSHDFILKLLFLFGMCFNTLGIYQFYSV